MFEKQIFQYIFSKKQKDLKDLKDPTTYYSLSTARRKKPTSKCIITKMIIQKKMRKERRRRRRARAIFRPLPLAPHPCSGLSRCQIFFTVHFEKWAEGGGGRNVGDRREKGGRGMDTERHTVHIRGRFLFPRWLGPLLGSYGRDFDDNTMGWIQAPSSPLLSSLCRPATDP